MDAKPDEAAARKAAARAKLCDLRRQIADLENDFEPPSKIGGSSMTGREAPSKDFHGSDGPSVSPRLSPDQGRAPSAFRAPDFRMTGEPRLDAALGGGLPAGGLIEIVGAQTRDGAAAAGLALALLRLACPAMPVLWIGAGQSFGEAGHPYLPGLKHLYGYRADQLFRARTRKLADALWIAEEAVALHEPLAALLEIRGNPSALDLTATRRLHLRASKAGRPLFLLRQAGQAGASAAPLRLLVEPAPADERPLPFGTPLAGSIGAPRFRVTLERCRQTHRFATLLLEWKSDEQRLAAILVADNDSTLRPGGPAIAGAVPPHGAGAADRGPVVPAAFDGPAAPDRERGGLARPFGIARQA